MSDKPDPKDMFRSVPMFAGCSDDQLDEIDRLADEVRVPAGRTVLKQGDLGSEFAIIIDGEADVVKDGVVVATLGPGDYFGELALLESLTRNASVVATTELRLQVIDRRGFSTLLGDIPRLGRALLSGAAHHLAQLEAENARLRAQLAERG